MSLIVSWLDAANAPGCPFPVNNLPCGVFSAEGVPARCGVAVGDQVLDMRAMVAAGLVKIDPALFAQPSWNAFMAAGASVWQHTRDSLQKLLAADGDRVLAEDSALRAKVFFSLDAVDLHLPFDVTEYTDFYAGRHHATNVGTLLRGADNALSAKWLHIPIGYNGRASSVVVSGTDLRRPLGQRKPSGEDTPVFGPSRRLDFELELGAVVGTGSALGEPVSVAEADRMIFGYVLLNDWSARDIQAWEYQPLGPFQAKAFASTIGPWIVTRAALEPFRVSTPPRELPLLPYLQEDGPLLYDIALAVDYLPAQSTTWTRVTTTNYSHMDYASAQQLAHHAVCGCPMRTGDLLGSGTISGPERNMCGSLLELSWGGQEPLTLDCGAERRFLEDGDAIRLRGEAVGKGFTVGFGSCEGRVLAALEDPFGAT
ncbi:MAG: fumarylacetoacetase [Pseudomonadota bacterium]